MTSARTTNATTTLIPANPQRREIGRIYRLEARSEFLKLLRSPAYAVPTLAFPLLFYVLFGLSFGGSQQAGPVSMATYLLATYGAFGVIGASLYGFGVGVATERGQGWMLLKRASPMPAGAYLTAKIAMSLLFGALIVVSLCALGSLFGGVTMPPLRWLVLGATLVAGALPFCALGLALGSYIGPNSAVAVVNLIYLPMSFASGLWIPVPVLPKLFQTVAPWLPAYHSSQLALRVIGADLGDSVGGHTLYLIVFTVLCLFAAWLGTRGEERKSYG